MFVSPYVTQRCPRLYPDPDHFNPENFSPKNEMSRHKFSFLAFSGGSRGCLGEQYSAFFSFRDFYVVVVPGRVHGSLRRLLSPEQASVHPRFADRKPPIFDIDPDSNSASSSARLRFQCDVEARVG